MLDGIPVQRKLGRGPFQSDRHLGRLHSGKLVSLSVTPSLRVSYYSGLQVMLQIKHVHRM